MVAWTGFRSSADTAASAVGAAIAVPGREVQNKTKKMRERRTQEQDEEDEQGRTINE